MKHWIIRIVAILVVFSTQAAHADFFLNSVDQKTSETIRLSKITLSAYSFKNADTQGEYRSSLLFLSTTKSEAMRRYKAGSMSFYRFQEVANDMEYLAFSLNTYFRNMKMYEKTGNSDYRDLAARNMSDSKSVYTRLKAIARKG